MEEFHEIRAVVVVVEVVVEGHVVDVVDVVDVEEVHLVVALPKTSPKQTTFQPEFSNRAVHFPSA